MILKKDFLYKYIIMPKPTDEKLYESIKKTLSKNTLSLRHIEVVISTKI